MLIMPGGSYSIFNIGKCGAYAAAEARANRYTAASHASFFCSNASIALARSLCKCLLAVLITAYNSFIVTWCQAVWCHSIFFSVLRLCGSLQVVAHCRADERIEQMQLQCPALGSQKWSGDHYAVQSQVRLKTRGKQEATKQKTPKNNRPYDVIPHGKRGQTPRNKNSNQKTSRTKPKRQTQNKNNTNQPVEWKHPETTRENVMTRQLVCPVLSRSYSCQSRINKGACWLSCHPVAHRRGPDLALLCLLKFRKQLQRTCV